MVIEYYDQQEGWKLFWWFWLIKLEIFKGKQFKSNFTTLAMWIERKLYHFGGTTPSSKSTKKTLKSLAKHAIYADGR
jgi:hypothetical protein